MSGDVGRVVAGEVTNPDHTELVELLADVGNYHGLNAALLGIPARVMGTGGAWTEVVPRSVELRLRSS